ncbi:GU4 nucleic-binding protein 1 [Verticillium dahliae VDG1]|nr:GU4 nucleic-binding protein 1 [Verticillium dahliae VDG1]
MAVAVGEKSLQKLLATLTTVLHPSTYMIFREAEGSTVIMKLEDAKARAFDYAFPSRMITLNVHSSLEAVGFLAVITARLAATGMGVNPVSGYFHDHLFVPEGREADALAVLQAIAVENRTQDTGEAS